MKRLYDYFEIEGLNLGRVAKSFESRGVTIYDFKRTGKKKARFSVKHDDCEKVFAIKEELCYNIKKKGTGGRSYPLFFIKTNPGLLIGAFLFVAAATFSGDFIYGVEFTGAGAIYKNEAYAAIKDCGAGVFSRFSDVDLKKLSAAVLKSNPRLSFVDCRRRGNYLIVDLAPSRTGAEKLTGDKTSLIAEDEGVVESVKVYRGTAKVAAGDRVKPGDELVSGEVTVKEQTVTVSVLATVTLVCEKEYVYVSSREGEETLAEAFAEEAFGKEAVSLATASVRRGEEVYYTVKISYLKTYFTG